LVAAVACVQRSTRAWRWPDSVLGMGRPKRQLTDDEEATIAAFVLPSERERLLVARGDVDDNVWAHRPPLDQTAMWQVPRHWEPEDLLADLRRRGAPEICTGIYGQLAGLSMSLPEAVTKVFAARYGDLISFIPGRLAYYDGEWKHESFVLSR
jgi:hypothetical protein